MAWATVNSRVKFRSSAASFPHQGEPRFGGHTALGGDAAELWAGLRADAHPTGFGGVVPNHRIALPVPSSNATMKVSGGLWRSTAISGETS